MNNRLKIKLDFTPTDKVFEMLGWTLVLGVGVLAITNYTNLPDTIPVHYNVEGQADRFGEKSGILVLPLISTIIFVGLTILNKFPHIFNYPTDITADNALRQYTNATRLIRYLKIIIVVIFGFIVLQTIRNVNG
jgi:uncharacterized membrane protein